MRALLLLLALLLPSPALAQLKYPAPALVNPTTIQLPTGPSVTKMDPAKDYIILCPKVKKVGYTMLQGGHNVVMRGGCHLTIAKGDAQRRVLYLNGITSAFHGEGILIDFSGDARGVSQGDGIAVNSPLATIQFQRSRVEGVLGTQSGFHGDILQTWGGAKEVRIDRFTGTSFYQGYQWPVTEGVPVVQVGFTDISRTNLKSLGPQTSESGGFLFWTVRGLKDHCDQPIPGRYTDVWAQGRAGRSLGQVVYPPTTNHPCPTKLTGTVITFPAQPKISGSINIGSPPQGDFAPAGAVGLAYNPDADVWKDAAPAPVPAAPAPAPADCAPVATSK